MDRLSSLVLALVLVVALVVSTRHLAMRYNCQDARAKELGVKVEVEEVVTIKDNKVDYIGNQVNVFEVEVQDLRGRAEKRQDVLESDLSSSFAWRPRGDEAWIFNVTCEVCKTFVGALQEMVTAERSQADIIKVAVSLCIKYKVETARICRLVVPQYSTMVVGVLQGTLLDPDQLCGFVLGMGCASPPDILAPWNITISQTPKPPVKPKVLPKARSPILRVLHLTDLHYDVMYRAGADADCGEPLCCRASDKYPAPKPNRKAGEWGDYRSCDMNRASLENMFKHLASIQHKFDYVMFTGDIAPHDVWNQTKADQLAGILRFTDLFRRYLPSKPVFTCPGNHEGVPCNSFPPSSVEGTSMHWLYSAYLEAWGYWLPPSTESTILRGGFYSFSPFPGLRIVSLNTNYGDAGNWWLLLNGTDPEGQLQWLADTLQDAENKGEKVHILSHFPPGRLLSSFAHNYRRLLDRYEGTVVAQFHGHTHKDEYEVMYAVNSTKRATGVSYVAGSVTPYSYTNPAFRIYTIDGNYSKSSWEVLDYTHYFLDIHKANKANTTTPKWSKEYSAKEAYGLPNLFPQAWSNLVYRMINDTKLFQKYHKYYFKGVPHAHCDARCKQDLLCSLKTCVPDDPNLCKDIYH